MKLETLTRVQLRIRDLDTSAVLRKPDYVEARRFELGGIEHVVFQRAEGEETVVALRQLDESMLMMDFDYDRFFLDVGKALRICDMSSDPAKLFVDRFVYSAGAETVTLQATDLDGIAVWRRYEADETLELFLPVPGSYGSYLLITELGGDLGGKIEQAETSRGSQ